MDLASVRINLASGLVGFERVFEVLDKPLAIADRLNAVELPAVRGLVEFEDVWFRYPPPAEVSIATLESRDEGAPALSDEPSAWVLKGLSFTAQPGTMTALVGPTGAGKTTICHLVPRLYDVSRGAVKIDGHDARGVTLESLGRALPMVPQDPHLFHDTVMANLRYARPGPSDEELAGACRVARIHDLIVRLPASYETMVGERGYRFSGGEKQRLAIARALLKGPSILILEEQRHIWTRRPRHWCRRRSPSSSRAHVVRHRSPPFHDPAGGPDPGRGRRPSGRPRHARAAACRGAGCTPTCTRPSSALRDPTSTATRQAWRQHTARSRPALTALMGH